MWSAVATHSTALDDDAKPSHRFRTHILAVADVMLRADWHVYQIGSRESSASTTVSELLDRDVRNSGLSTRRTPDYRDARYLTVSPSGSIHSATLRGSVAPANIRSSAITAVARKNS